MPILSNALQHVVKHLQTFLKRFTIAKIYSAAHQTAPRLVDLDLTQNNLTSSVPESYAYIKSLSLASNPNKLAYVDGLAKATGL